MGESERSRRDLMRDIAVAVPALGVGALLASGLGSLRRRPETAQRELRLDIEHRYPGWTDSNYATGDIVSTLTNEGPEAERDVRWELQAAGRQGSELLSWNVHELFRPAASTVTVGAPASASPVGLTDIEAAVTSETPAGSRAFTLFTVLVRRLDPGESVRLEATFRGTLTLVTQEAQSRETAASGYLRVGPASPATPAAT